MQTQYTTEDGRVFIKVPGRCRDCAGFNDKCICRELPSCETIIGARGEPVNAMWREVRND
jgi:hypothetical protein